MCAFLHFNIKHFLKISNISPLQYQTLFMTVATVMKSDANYTLCLFETYFAGFSIERAPVLKFSTIGNSISEPIALYVLHNCIEILKKC